ncbi:MAG TPA: sulfur carrier protein ThiS [Candidatus Gastranaerophilaceae bacterium]|nr:sulfur carrier protein ThiS [Candidatus Gastranaerophilaceae bacterium]
MTEINLKINGKDIVLKNSSTIEELIKERQVSGNMFVVEQNLTIVPKEIYSTTPIKENDSIEIVGFFGGG